MFSRKLALGFALGLCAALLSGCDSEVEDIRQQVTGDYPVQTRTYAASEEATFAAARQALKQIDFRFTHGGRHQGEMEASSRIAPGDEVGSSQQFSLKATFEPTLDGKGTAVTVEMTQVLEPDTEHHLGQGVESPLRDTALYDAFFAGIRRDLMQPPADAASAAAPAADQSQAAPAPPLPPLR
ncbi:MAG: hypothetical protein ACREFX_07780 [Opitutaceae bacterium]